MCFESKNSPWKFRLWKPSQAILQAHCVIDVILLPEVGALANDLPNRIIDVHHGLHGQQPKPRPRYQQETKKGAGFRLSQKDLQKIAAACFVITSSLHSVGGGKRWLIQIAQDSRQAQTARHFLKHPNSSASFGIRRLGLRPPDFREAWTAIGEAQ